jgi:hypothetical protein
MHFEWGALVFWIVGVERDCYSGLANQRLVADTFARTIKERIFLHGLIGW